MNVLQCVSVFIHMSVHVCIVVVVAVLVTVSKSMYVCVRMCAGIITLGIHRHAFQIAFVL